MHEKKIKICFVALNIYPLLSNAYPEETIGGAELQQAYIGKTLLQNGFLVSYIVQDYGQPDNENIDGLLIKKTYAPRAGIMGLRFFYPRLFKIWKALVAVDADIYYVRCASFHLGILAFFCRRYKKKFVFAGANDLDFVPDKLRIKLARDRWLYKYGLRRVHKIIVQTETQKKLLLKNFGREGLMIRNLSPQPPRKSGNDKERYILWVSTIRAIKNPLHFVRLAQKMPEEKFIMIGGEDEFQKALYETVVKKAGKIANLTFLGFQPLNKVENYFDACKVFVNTSEYEGFPNTFLQAWRRGIPVISYLDPDRLIVENGLGQIVDCEEKLPQALRKTIADGTRQSETIVDYYRTHHQEGIARQYVDLFGELAAKPVDPMPLN